MRGKKRTKEQKHELFGVIDLYLEMGFSLKKACIMCGVPYSSMRDLIDADEVLRAKTNILKNRVNTKARQNIIDSINKGSVTDSKWWLERFDDDLNSTESNPEDMAVPKTVSDNKIVFVDFSGTPEQLEKYTKESTSLTN